ncbi:MAG TPA: hypothetical protein VG537_06915, partial [Candidatus Kapabacteria bacterium]|nr:hypothetical protein [Candidatus Kapabacteria bacterium]
STNNGQSWDLSEGVESGIEGIAWFDDGTILINPNPPSHLWHSTDGGVNWATYGVILDSSHPSGALASSPGSKDIFLLQNRWHRSGDTVYDVNYRSTDEGATWSAFTFTHGIDTGGVWLDTVVPKVYDIRVLDNGRILAVTAKRPNETALGYDSTTGEGIYISMDHGFTWAIAPHQPPTWCQYFSCGETNSIYVYDGFNIFETTDSGMTWIKRGLSGSNGFPTNFIYSMYAAKDGSLLIGSIDQGVFYSSDHGMTFASINSGLHLENLTVHVITSTPDGHILLGTSAGIYENTLASIEGNAGLPFSTARWYLPPTYPDPAFTTTSLSLNIDFPSHIRVRILNTLGVTLATVVDGEYGSGPQVFTANVSSYPAGVYYFAVTDGELSSCEPFVKY